MKPELRASYNALRDYRLPNVIRQISLRSASAQVALSNGLGDGIQHARDEQRKRRAKGKAARAARRRNR